MGYKWVTIRDYFKHLDSVWCKMDTKTITKMTVAFYEPWDQVIHITKFTKNINKQQAYLKTTSINIFDKHKLQFYTE